jgi:hypothetical protein
MIHINVENHGFPDAHYAVGHNGLGSVLLQVQDHHGSQARIALTAQEAREVIQALNFAIAEAHILSTARTACAPPPRPEKASLTVIEGNTAR